MAPAALSLAAAAAGVAAFGVAIAIRQRRRSADARRRRLDAPPLGLRDGETAPAALRRMEREQIAIAIEMLRHTASAAAGLPADAAAQERERLVHETRKAIKRARTLLRMRAAEVPSAQRARRAALLRDAGRALAAARDADVALVALRQLMRSHPKRVGSSPAVARLHAALEQRRALAAAGTGGAQALALLLDATGDLPSAPSAPPGTAAGFASIRPGLERIYRRGRRGMRRARRRGDAASMHDWRKRAKDLRHAAEALALADGRSDGRLRAIAREAHDLGEALGEEHDLAMLAGLLEEHRSLFKGQRRARRELAKRIEDRRAALRRRAFKTGERLYRPKPTRFVARVRRALELG